MTLAAASHNRPNENVLQACESDCFLMIPRGAPDLTCFVRGRQWLSLPGNWRQMETDIDVFYIQPVYEHLMGRIREGLVSVLLTQQQVMSHLWCLRFVYVYLHFSWIFMFLIKIDVYFYIYYDKSMFTYIC
jgi:hypothetical protein